MKLRNSESIYMASTSASLARYKAFLTRHKSWEDGRLRSLQLRFQKLPAALKSLLSVKNESDRNEAPDFNVFQILGWDCSEVRTHSAFLADILDPRGRHGQGDMFLMEFIDLCIRKMESIPSLRRTQKNLSAALLTPNEWTIKREKPVVIENNKEPRPRRLDIVLICRKPRILIVIENKIHSQEGDNQLEDYRKWMKNQRLNFPSQLLLYLTLEGDESKTRSEDFQLSYREDISTWLSKPKAAAYSVKEIVRQYLQLIRSLTAENKSMNTNYERELADWLLSQKENLHVVFEITSVFPLLKQKMLRQFWDQISDSMRTRLQKGSTDWQLLPESGNPLDRETWFGIELGLVGKQSEALELRFKIEQDLPKDFAHGEFSLYFGVHSRQELSGEWLKRLQLLPEYQSLQKALILQECKATNQWWPGYKTRNMASFDRFLAKFSGNQGDMIEDVVDELWNLFLGLRDYVGQANQAIAKNKGRVR